MMDWTKEIVRDVLLEDTTKIVSTESKSFLRRILEECNKVSMGKFSGSFHEFLMNKYGSANVKVLREAEIITGIVWMRPKQFMNAQFFSDVLCIDTTAHKNNIRWPCVLITGRNNNNRIVILLQGIIMFETKECFKWVFEQFRLIAQLGETWIPSCIFSDDALYPNCLLLSSNSSIYPLYLNWSASHHKTLLFCDWTNNKQLRICSWHRQRICMMESKFLLTAQLI
jgi:hypothetical protein